MGVAKAKPSDSMTSWPLREREREIGSPPVPIGEGIQIRDLDINDVIRGQEGSTLQYLLL
jgi:hypothetical protein